MAVRETHNEDSLKKLKKDIDCNSLKNIYIFYGEEAYLKNLYENRIKQALIPTGCEAFNLHQFSSKNTTLQEISDSIDSFPMLCDKTLVIIKDFDLFKQDETSRNFLIKLFSDFPDYCTAIFVYDTIEYKRDGKMKKLCDAIKNNVEEVEFSLQSESDLKQWVKRELKNNGLQISSETCDHLFFLCGTSMLNLKSELEKLSSYVKDNEVKISDINSVCTPILDAEVFDMTNYISKSDFNHASAVLADLLRMQEPPIKILAAIGVELKHLYTARMALDHNKDRTWVQKVFGLKSDYAPKLWISSARNTTHEWCSYALKSCQILDRRLKSEAKIDAEQELKLFLMELANRNETKN